MIKRMVQKPNCVSISALLTVALLAVSSAYEAAAQNTQHYTQTNLVSNLASLAPTKDANLVNSWGLARSSKSPWWVADNGPGLSTLYSGTGTIVPLVVTVPTGGSSSPTGTPTGIVFNGDSTAFPLAGKPSTFIFVTEDGTISAWNGGTAATIVVNNGNKSVFKGVSIAVADTAKGPQSFLYAADFRKGEVSVYDSNFNPVYFPEGFDDDCLRHGFAPFNVQNIGGNLYVSFAKQGSDKHDEIDGAGLGYVDIFSPHGRLLGRLEHGSWFNAPWGLALASSDFGLFSHDVLVGQFGSGQILAFDAVTGKFKGTLNDSKNNPIHIDGLWAIAFGNNATAGPSTTLFFTAGPDGETNGLFGTITAVENQEGGDR